MNPNIGRVEDGELSFSDLRSMFIERECISLGFVNLQIMAYHFPTKIYINFYSGQVVVVEKFIEFVEEEFS